MRYFYASFIVWFLFSCTSNDQRTEEKLLRDSTFVFHSTPAEIENANFKDLIQNFDIVSLPYQLASLPTVHKLSGDNHRFLREQLHGKQIVNIPEKFEGMWERTHHDKFNINEHKPIGGVSLIAQNENFILLEISDLEEFNYRDSLYTYRKATFLCSFNPKGEYINGITACYADGDPMGGVERKTSIDKSLKIKIQEVGFDKIKLSKGYRLDANFQVQDDGKIVYIDAKVEK
ncbi:MAG: hypothetical protein MUE81_04500 [Thermoflexibacter sp.]|nr:hypothetical protein [Thermoflexibacter sp.]